MNPQTDRAAAIVEQYGCKTENLIAILQDIQAAYNYLSEANLTLVADRLGISQSYISRLEKRIIHTLKAQLESE